MTKISTSSFIESIEKEWKSSFPNEDINCEPAVTYLVILSQLLAKKVDNALSEFSLNRGEMEVLCAIVRTKNHTLVPKLVRERTVVSSGGLTARIDKLESLGLIQRKLNPEDKRGFLLVATPKGIKVAVASHKKHVEVEQSFISSLSVKERNTLKILLKKVMDAL